MKIISALFLLISLSHSFPSTAGIVDPFYITKNPEYDKTKLAEYNRACHLNDILLVRKQFKVDCHSNYQHYGPTSVTKKSSNRPLRIAGYNLLHPGTSKALFKDYSLIAKIMNKYDLVSGMELLGVVGHDRANNESVIDLLTNNKKAAEDLKILREKTTDPKKINEIDEKLAKISSVNQTAYSLYRSPGYYKILMALKKLDPSWALVLSPRGDSALEGSVEEMVGFFYRANEVTPAKNPHCAEYKDENGGNPIACIINVGENFMGKNYVYYFARRPFMGSFRSGGLEFSLVSTHVLFNFSGDEYAEKRMMNDVFGVDDADELGTGINSSNFARFAEVKLTLDFMNRFRSKYKDNKIMLVSDTNINANNLFWPEVLKSFPGGKLYIDEASTISPPRFSSDGKETNGVASSYDHFIYDKTAFPGCDDGQVYNYYKSDIQADIENIYMIRNKVAGPWVPPLRLKSLKTFDDQGALDGDVPPDDEPLPAKLDYPMSSIGEYKMATLIGSFSVQLQSLYTIKRNEIVPDDFQLQERIDGFKRRVFVNQLTNAFYYRFYQEVLSDHFPVSINCKKTISLKQL